MGKKTAIAVIGGTGVYDLSLVKQIGEHRVKTPFGDPSDLISEVEIEGTPFYFLPGHGRAHQWLPQEVNYCANIYGLKKLGAKYVVSVSSVGSLKDELPPGTFVLPDQFIDWTKGFRRRTFFGDGLVGHVSAAVPVESKLREMIAQSCEKVGIKYSNGGSYLCIEGPQFSSKAESTIYRTMNASVIGMTNVPESYLAKEAGMAYATIAMVTDYDCWKEVHCTVEEIMKVAKENNQKAQKVLQDLLPKLGKNLFSFNAENGIGIMTPRERMLKKHKEIVDVLLK